MAPGCGEQLVVARVIYMERGSHSWNARPEFYMLKHALRRRPEEYKRTGTAPQNLIDVLDEARSLLAEPDNDFAWSSWKAAGAACREIDRLVSLLASGSLPPRGELSVLFAPTGPIQEVSISSGWGDEFLRLAQRFDRAAEQAYGGGLLARLQQTAMRLGLRRNSGDAKA
jgi:hypothetical protein